MSLQVQEAQLQVADRDSQLEELRNRITVIAELFEKKAIKQRYSFEVLCDFIHDKAKRLFNKYDAVMKEKKQLQADDKNHRKIFKLEQEVSSLNEMSNLVRNYAVPLMMNLLNREFNREDQLSNEFVKQLIQDMEF